MSTIPNISQELVNEALASAVAHGCTHENCFSHYTALELAEVIRDADTNFCNAVPEDLEPYVEVWLAALKREMN